MGISGSGQYRIRVPNLLQEKMYLLLLEKVSDKENLIPVTPGHTSTINVAA